MMAEAAIKTTPVDDLPELIQERIKTDLESKQRTIPHTSNWASVLGEPCDRCRYLWRTSPDKAKPISQRGREAIENGKDEEQATKIYLQELGFHIYVDRPEHKKRWEAYNISTSLDFWVSIDGTNLELAEHKAPSSEWTFNKINSADDMKYSDSIFVRKWYTQCQTYLWVHERNRMLFLLKAPGRKAWKIFWVYLDYDEGETLTKRAEIDEINVKNKTCPGFLGNDPAHCQSCPFFGRACNPPLLYSPAKFDNNEEAVEKINRWFALKPLKSEYDRLDKELKTPYKDGDSVGELFIVGDYEITTRSFPRKGYTVEPGKTYRVDIKKLTPDMKLIEDDEPE